MKLDFDFHLDTGFSTRPRVDPDKTYDLVVVGAGPAGLNAALYAARKGLSTVVLGRKKGGQILDTSAVDNYIGVEGLTGEELADRFLAHLARYGVPVVGDAEVVGHFRDGRLHHLVVSSGEDYRCRAVVVATGSTPRQLGIPGEKEYAGKGVAYCAICDAPLFIGKDVFVAGGGNSAVQAALDLSRQSRSVTLVHRSQLRADKVMVDQLYATPNIAVFLKTRVVEIVGESAMTGIRVEEGETGARRTLPGDGIFIEIGHLPNTGIFGKLLRCSEHGEIVVSRRMETSVPGIFAAGDVTDGPFKQIVVAAGDGAVAALSAGEYISRTDF